MIFSQHGIFSTYVELSQNVIFSTENCFITSLNSHHQVKKLQQHTRIHLTCLNFQNVVKNVVKNSTQNLTISEIRSQMGRYLQKFSNFQNTAPPANVEFPEYCKVTTGKNTT